eukprot:6530835-Pyramimonas_sp.AAC.1
MGQSGRALAETRRIWLGSISSIAFEVSRFRPVLSKRASRAQGSPASTSPKQFGPRAPISVGLT